MCQIINMYVCWNRKRSLQQVHSCHALWAWIVPDAPTSVRAIISSFAMLFSFGAAPNPPIFRKAACSCICLPCPWRPCSAYLILRSPPHFACAQRSPLLLLSGAPLRVNFTGSKIKAENPKGGKDGEKMKAKIKRVWNPLQSPYLDVCHHFVCVSPQPSSRRASAPRSLVWTA